jgi:hypothetical protein
MTADKNVAIRSIGPANINIYANSTLKIWKSELKADSKINAGKNNCKIKCGLILLHAYRATPNLPI